MKKQYKVLGKFFYVILLAISLLNFPACDKEDNTVNVEEDKTVYVELDVLADIFGNRDSTAQNEEIAKVIDFFNANDQLWGFTALGISYSDSTITSIPAATLSSRFDPKSNFWGPFAPKNVLMLCMNFHQAGGEYFWDLQLNKEITNTTYLNALKYFHIASIPG